jgi:ribonucleoside-triphosphate reductase
MAEKVKRTLEQIDAEIEAVKAELNDVHGTETEVYARIVGYYRAVRNWNKGKRDEFNNRRLFTVNDSYDESRPMNTTVTVNHEKTEVKTGDALSSASATSYQFFMRKTCPNCPPVKAYMAEVSMEGSIIDVDTDAGLREAALKGVFSAPTVIFYASDGSEIGRGHSVEEIKAVLAPLAVVA